MIFPNDPQRAFIVIANKQGLKLTCIDGPLWASGDDYYAQKYYPTGAGSTEEWNFERTAGPDPGSFYIYRGVYTYLWAEGKDGEIVHQSYTKKTAWIVEPLGYNFIIRVASNPDLVIDYAPDLDLKLKTNTYNPANAEENRYQIWTIQEIS